MNESCHNTAILFPGSWRLLGDSIQANEDSWTWQRQKIRMVYVKKNRYKKTPIQTSTVILFPGSWRLLGDSIQANESCHAHIKESCHSYERVMSHKSYPILRLLEDLGVLDHTMSSLPFPDFSLTQILINTHMSMPPWQCSSKPPALSTVHPSRRVLTSLGPGLLHFQWQRARPLRTWT